jgi:hypothetical protein
VDELKGSFEAMEEGRAMPPRQNPRDTERKLWPGMRVRVFLPFSFLLVLCVLGLNSGATHSQTTP